MSRLFRRREENQKSLWEKIRDVALADVTVLARGGVDEGSLERLEEVLIAADFGVASTLRLVDVVETLAARGEARSQQDFLDAVRREIVAILSGGRADTALRMNFDGPTIVLVAGVNGVGKTTTIGKLAHRFKRQGREPLIAAADTFRAGAIDQLQRWSERVGCAFVGSEPGRDPAAVAFDAVETALDRGVDIALVDTAGRLHTQYGLMQELEKIERVIARKLPGAPHEKLLVLDSTVGQNALAQVRTFGQSIDLTGLVLTKMDSTAKGGVVVALKQEFDLPVKFIGVGEGIEDLVPFDVESFAEEVLTG